MSVSQFNPQDPLALAPADCDRGHACQFCPEEPSCRLDNGHHE